MTLKYQIEEFKLPVNGKLQIRQKIRIVKGDRIDLEELSKRIADSCTVSEPDVLAVTSALYQQMKSELLKGNIVDMGDLGTIRLRANNRQLSVEKDEKIGRKIPARIRLYYQNPKLLQELVRQVRFKKKREQKTTMPSASSNGNRLK
ncbi:MAG: HU family DNA-binding protein [Marinifilaceae bacterium]